MVPENDNAFIRSLLADGPLSEGTILKAMKIARRADDEDIELANSIIPGAGDYLPSFLISAVICADMTDEHACLEIAKQKEFFSRLSTLLPDCLQYFRFEPSASVFNCLSCLCDCHNDFWITFNSGRQDKNKREILSSISKAARSVSETLAAFEEIDRITGSEYDDVYRIYMKRLHNENRLIGFRSLIEHLKFSKDFLDLHYFRSCSEQDYLFVNHNQARTVVVNYVYTMSRFWNGPPLTTTPGSDFSALCSLVFEIVSGATNESLAGAINRYSRSDDRRKADSEDNESRLYEERIESDNFYHAKDTIKRSLAICDKYVAMLKDSQIGDGPKLLLTLLIQEEMERAKAADAEYGPHLLWLSQATQSYLDEKVVELKRVREAKLKLGQLRRKNKEQKST